MSPTRLEGGPPGKPPPCVPDDRAAHALEELLAGGQTLRGLERALGLSHGYLSKVRHGAVRPSGPLTALLVVLAAHPAALATVRAATAAEVQQPQRPEPSFGRALLALRALAPAFAEARVRWALAGDAALRAWVPDAPLRPGVDVVVDARDRHVLAVVRAAGHAVANHPPELAIGQLGSADPNDTLRVHFPRRPPLADAVQHAELREGLPVVDLVTVTLANLLSHRTGADQAAAIAVRGGASVAELAARLEALGTGPAPRSPYVRRTFDTALARSRLASLIA